MQIIARPFIPAALPEAVATAESAAVGRGRQGTAETLQSELNHFWDGMMDTMEERTGVEAIEHDRARDSAYLASKGRALRAEVDRMPDGPGKEAALEKLDSFLQKQTARIQNTYQREMAAQAGEGPVLDERSFQSKIRMKTLL